MEKALIKNASKLFITEMKWIDEDKEAKKENFIERLNNEMKGSSYSGIPFLKVEFRDNDLIFVFEDIENNSPRAYVDFKSFDIINIKE